jgi:signal transduction histidine kinase
LVRRIGCAFALLILLAAAGAGSLVALLGRTPHGVAVLGALAAALALALVGGFVLAFRRVARGFAEQDRLRRQLLADVAHELRTPLAILQGRLEGVLDGVYPVDEAQLQRLLDEVRRLGRLVEDVGTLANAEAGALELRREPVDAVELARDVAAGFARPIHLDLPAELPVLEADPLRLREVLLNLLSNADRHTPPEGSITLAARAERQGVALRVADTGGGIPPEELPRIFDRFHKGEGSRGSGLGLAIARDLVRAHGGTIRAESELGRGTTVTVWLPV